MAAYVHDARFFTTRTTVLFVIIGLHIFIGWAIATGLARKAIEVLAPPIQTDIVQEEQKKVEPPPPPPPEMQRPPVEVPPPDVVIDMPVETAQNTAITNVTTKSTAPPPAPVKTGSRVSAKGKRFPNTEDYYPPASKRLGEEGTSQVHICVSAAGKLAGVPTIAKTSGSARLDEGAINLTKAATYVAGSEDGKPIDDCFNVNIKFQLTK